MITSAHTAELRCITAAASKEERGGVGALKRRTGGVWEQGEEKNKLEANKMDRMVKRDKDVEKPCYAC